MRSRLISMLLCVYLAIFVIGCNKPASDSTAENAATDTQAAPGTDEKGSGREAHQRKERVQQKEAKREPLIVPAGTAVTVSLGSTVGSKASKAGDTFTGSVAKEVTIGNNVALPQGANVSGTVTDAKPLGRFAGGAALQIRLDSINIKGTDIPVQASA